MDSDEQLSPRDWWSREMYARFGVAIYLGQALELQLVNHLTAMRLGAGLDLDGIDDLMRRWFSQTMGAHVKEVAQELGVDSKTATLLQEALALRNWLVHHYFRAEVHRLGTVEGMRSISDDLRGYAEQLQRADAALTAETRQLMATYALTQEVVAAASDSFLADVKVGKEPADFRTWRGLFDEREPPGPAP
jgi:hypothetical protein